MSMRVPLDLQKEGEMPMLALMTELFNGTYGHNGNPKVGTGVSIVNREAGVTCPGASTWCVFCYAKHGNFQRFGLQNKFATTVLKIPVNIRELFRWHVSGDFDSIEYIRMAIDLMTAHPDTNFWAYTRSWDVPDLLPELERMRALPNMQLFASVDPDMPEPPTSWRVAFPETDDRFTGVLCLEQACSKACPEDCTGNVKRGHVSIMPDCKACTYCWRKPAGNVRWKLHSTK
jgi:hypothetical protein